MLAGIDQALTAGLRVKSNMVPLRGYNHEQILPMLDYCLAGGVELRLIQLMRMGHLARDRQALPMLSLPQLNSSISSANDSGAAVFCRVSRLNPVAISRADMLCNCGYPR